jgi:hypothetical protein
MTANLVHGIQARTDVVMVLTMLKNPAPKGYSAQQLSVFALIRQESPRMQFNTSSGVNGFGSVACAPKDVFIGETEIRIGFLSPTGGPIDDVI